MAFPIDQDLMRGVWNPAFWGRWAWQRWRKGWRHLLAGSSKNTQLILMSGFYWTIPQALIEPFKNLYLNRLGFDNLALGGITGLDMGLRAAGTLLGGWLGLRFGHKRTLNWGDFISWFVSSLVLAFATQPWHVWLWALLMSTNSVVGASFQHLLIHSVNQDRRSRVYAFFNLSIFLPGIFLPFLTSQLLKRFDLVVTIRCLLVIQALSMGIGILWRRMSLVDDSRPSEQAADLGSMAKAWREIVAHVSVSQRSLAILLVCWIANVSTIVWRTYYGLYATQSAGFQPADLGPFAQWSAISVAVASLFVIPLLQAKNEERDFFYANLAGLLPGAFMLFWPTWAGHASLNVVAGIAGAFHVALSWSLLSASLPQRHLALAIALYLALTQGVMALGTVAAGWLFRDGLSAFPWSQLALNLGMTLAAAWAWALARSERRR